MSSIKRSSETWRHGHPIPASGKCGRGAARTCASISVFARCATLNQKPQADSSLQLRSRGEFASRSLEAKDALYESLGRICRPVLHCTASGLRTFMRYCKRERRSAAEVRARFLHDCLILPVLSCLRACAINKTRKCVRAHAPPGRHPASHPPTLAQSLTHSYTCTPVILT